MSQIVEGSACGLPGADGPREAEPPKRSGWQLKLEELLGIDLRSLALYRVMLALLLLADLAYRSQDLVAHYTDDGVLPRAAMQNMYPWLSSIHALSGSVWWQVVLFLTAAFFATAMLVGWRTQVVTVISWVLLVSLQNRASAVLQAGDVLLRLLLLWAILLPIGARWSLDSAMNTLSRKHNGYVSVATAALLLQVCFVYWFGAIAKWAPIWVDNEAVYYALHIDALATPIAIWLREITWLLPLLTWFTLQLEIWGPIAAFAPFWTGPIRFIVVLLFIGLHVSFGLCMWIGLFPLISIAGWLVFVPGWFWDRLFERLATHRRTALRIYYDGTCGFCQKMVRILHTFLLIPETKVAKAQTEPDVDALMQRENSWVLIPADGTPRFRWDALCELFRHSPFAWPLAWVMRLPLIRNIGDTVYRWVATNRGVGAKALAWLRPAPMYLRPTLLSSALALFLLLFVLAWNVRAMDESYRPYAPRGFDRIGRALRLDQRWFMFAPRPSWRGGWFIVRGVLADGSEMDLWRKAPLSWDRPDDVPATYVNYRWRKYLEQVKSTKRGEKQQERYRRWFCGYLCRQWNAEHPPEKHVKHVEVWFVVVETRPVGEGKSDPVPHMLLAYDPVNNEVTNRLLNVQAETGD